MLKLLKNRNFSLLFIGNFTSQIGTAFYNFAVSWFILTITSSPLQAGVYIASGAIVQLIFSPIAGVFADRLNKIRILYMTDYIRGITVLIGGLMIFSFSQTSFIIALLYSVTIILAINNAFFISSVAAVRPLLVKDEELNQANAFFSLIGSIQQIIGVLLAGGLYVLLGIELIFIINGVSFMISGFSEMFIQLKPTRKLTEDSPGFFEDFKYGMQYILSKQGLLQFMLAVLFLNFAVSPLFANAMPYLFNLRLGKEPIHLSMVQVSFSVGMLVGGIIVGVVGQRLVIRNNIRQGITGTFIGLGTVMFLMYQVHQDTMPYPLFYSLLIPVFFFTAVANMWLNIPLSTGLVRAIDPHVRGRVFSIMDTLGQGLIPLGILVSGIILEFSGLGILFMGITAIALTPFLILLFGKRVNLLLTSL